MDKSTKAQLVDLSVMLLGYDSFTTWVATQPVNPEKKADFKKLATAAERMLRVNMPELIQALEAYIIPLVDSQPVFAPISSLLERSMIGSPVQVAEKLGPPLWRLYDLLGNHPGLIRDLFDDTRQVRVVMLLDKVVKEESHSSRLNKLAGIPFYSGKLQVIRRWLEGAAAFAGAPVSVAESLVNDAEVVKSLGKEFGDATAELGKIDPNTPRAADLEDRRIGLLNDIREVAKSSANPGAVLGAGILASTPPSDGYRSAVSRRLGMNPQQEDAMMAEGKVIIAAGAGSGKTRVMAAKVAYHIEEKGVSPNAILASSFTRKASYELVHRIKEYGAPIDKDKESMGNFGTSHAIAGRLMGRLKQPYVKAVEGYKEMTLVRLAMEQVKMLPSTGNIVAPPPPTSMFHGVFETGTLHSMGDPAAARRPLPTGTQAPVAPARPMPEMDVKGLDFKTAFDRAARMTHRLNSFDANFMQNAMDPQSQWYPVIRGQTRNFAETRRLSDAQKKIIQRVFDRLNIPFSVYDNAPIVQEEAPQESVSRFAAANTKKERGGLKKYTSSTTPVNEWFNIGDPLIEDEKPIPAGRFKSYVSRMKGLGKSPTECWHEDQSPEAAVYGAYEYLKGPKGESEFVNTPDLTDTLIKFCQTMIANKGFLAELQRQFKVILVDEAQDNSRIQAYMFGLISGYLDPKTLKPYEDKRMTASTYAWVGDDRQAIYEFRGADPDTFIGLSDMVVKEDGLKGDFVTKVLNTNFRSGKVIVEAANKLVARNKHQIPIACNPNPDRKSHGAINAVTIDDEEYASVFVAEKIQALVNDPSSGIEGYSHFGVAVRSNAEQMAYGLELLKRGIPFRAKVSFFKDALTKALVSWLTLARYAKGGPLEEINQAFMGCFSHPKSFLGEAFSKKFLASAKGNYINHLRNTVDDYEAWQRKSVDALLERISSVQSLSGSPEDVINFILNMKGSDGETIRESMIEAVKEDDETIKQLLEKSEGEEISEEEIEDLAMASVKPLIGLIRNYTSLDPALDYVERLRKANEKLSLGEERDEVGKDAVNISTMHGWKGLEVPHMFVPMMGGRFPRNTEEGPSLWSERRLAYVAITRAEEECTILDIPHHKTRQHSQFIMEGCIPYVDVKGVPVDLEDDTGEAPGDALDLDKDMNLDNEPDLMESEDAPF